MPLSSTPPPNHLTLSAVSGLPDKSLRFNKLSTNGQVSVSQSTPGFLIPAVVDCGAAAWNILTMRASVTGGQIPNGSVKVKTKPYSPAGT